MAGFASDWFSPHQMRWSTILENVNVGFVATRPLALPATAAALANRDRNAGETGTPDCFENHNRSTFMIERRP